MWFRPARSSQSETDVPEQRRCSGCGTNYESIDELHQGGWCPQCGSTRHEPAVTSKYVKTPKPESEPEPEKKEPLPGSTEDYLGE